MFALGPRSRAGLVAGGLVAFGLAYAITPLGARGAGPPPAAGSPPAAEPSPPPAIAVLPRRDPFAGAPEPHPSAAPAPAGAPTLPPLPPLPAIPSGLGPLPPNAGAGLGPLPGTGPRVSAIVTGRHPYALLEDAAGTHVVATGDAVAGDRITAIDGAGVHLAHGSTLPIPLPLGGLP